MNQEVLGNGIEGKGEKMRETDFRQELETKRL
jgi:hypothetical protein